MDSKKHIQQLLEKYWSCETSLEEEKQLRDYFNNSGPSISSVPELAEGVEELKWKETAELFRYYEQQRNMPLQGSDFDASIMKKIREKEPRGKTITMMTHVARIAAGVVVMAVAIFLVRQEIKKQYPPEVVDTYSDPKLALEETKKAFMMISKSFGKAQQEVKSINLLNEAEKKIGEKKDEQKEESNI